MIGKTRDTFSEEPPLVDQLIWSRDNAAGVTLAQDEVEELCDIIRNLEAERDAAVMAEREACAALCDVVTQDHIGDIIRGIGDDIRARRNKGDG